MNNIYIANNEDLFNIEIPNFEPEVVEKPLVSNDVKTIDNTVDSNFVAYSIIVFCTFLVIFVFLFLRKLSKNNNSVIRQSKNNKGYISSNNKLETPDTIEESIYSFLERTKN